MRTVVALASLSFVPACSEPLPVGEPTGSVDMTAAIGATDLDLAGIAVDPDSGRRFVLDATRGIYELAADGSATAVVPMADMPDPGVDVRLPFTDIASLGGSRLALTAIGDGFILDLAADRLDLHFCYEPGFSDPSEDQEQRTDAVAFDPAAGHIIAQPRTVLVGSGEITASQIGYYDRATGFDLRWYEVPLDLSAGGMAVLPEIGLVLSDRTALHAFDGSLRPFDQLERFGISSIEGLAYDPSVDSLLVLDSKARRLVAIAVADLGL